MRAVPAVALCLVLMLAACSDRSSAGRASTPLPAAVGGAQPVRLDAGGTSLGGWLYGRPARNAVLLVAGAGRGPEVWEQLARDLTASGFLVLSLRLPEAGGTGGAAVVRAAVAYLASRGAEHTAVIGEGAAGAAALTAAGNGERVSGVAALSAPVSYRGPLGEADAAAAIGRIDGPVLLMASAGDGAAADARRLYDAAREPRTLALVPGAAYGADLLGGTEGTQARAVLRDFLREAFAERSA